MSLGNTTENDLMKVIFLNDSDPTWRTQSYLYLALHTADPGEAGLQTTNECAYTNYARVAVAKTAAGWTVSGNQAQNAALIQFPQCGGGSETASYFSLGTATSGGGQILYSAALNSPLAISNLIQPQFAAGQLTFTAD